MYGNKGAINETKIYALRKSTAPLIFHGIKGVGKSIQAKHLASVLLDCSLDKLSINPDYLYIENPKGLKVEDMREMLRKITLCCNGNKRVVIIDDANEMTVAAQNCLLKTLEEDNERNVFILIAHNKMLSTIHSRAYEIDFYPLSEEDMQKGLADLGIPQEEHMLFKYLSVGSLGVASDIYNNLNMPVIKSIYNKLSNIRERDELLSACNSLKEKDANCLYDVFKDRSEYLLNFFKNIFEMLLFSYLLNQPTTFFSSLNQPYSLEEIMNVMSYLSQYKESGFSKNDYFNFLVKLASKEA